MLARRGRGSHACRIRESSYYRRIFISVELAAQALTPLWGAPSEREPPSSASGGDPSSGRSCQCIQTAAFSDRARSTRWRLSAPQSPLVTLFPLVSLHLAQRSDCAAAGRRREVLEVAFKSASARDEPSCPTRSDPYHPRVVLELRKSAMLNTNRVLRIKMSQPSLIVVFSSAVVRRPTARPTTRASPRRGGTSPSTPWTS
jgi:hypothetical protein